MLICSSMWFRFGYPYKIELRVIFIKIDALFRQLRQSMKTDCSDCATIYINMYLYKLFSKFMS